MNKIQTHIKKTHQSNFDYNFLYPKSKKKCMPPLYIKLVTRSLFKFVLAFCNCCFTLEKLQNITVPVHAYTIIFLLYKLKVILYLPKKDD